MNEEMNVPEINQGGLGSKREAVLLQVIEDLERQLKDSADSVELWKSATERLKAEMASWSEKWYRAKTLFEASIEEDGVDTDDLSENMNALVQMFGIEFTEEVYLTVTVTYSGTVTVPKGAEMGDLCLEVEPDWDVNVELDGDTVGNLGLQGTDYDY